MSKDDAMPPPEMAPNHCSQCGCAWDDHLAWREMGPTKLICPRDVDSIKKWPIRPK